MENVGYHNESDGQHVVRAAAVWGVVTMVMRNRMAKGMVERMEVQVAFHRLHNDMDREMAPVHAGDSESQHRDEQEGLELLEV